MTKAELNLQLLNQFLAKKKEIKAAIELIVKELVELTKNYHSSFTNSSVYSEPFNMEYKQLKGHSKLANKLNKVNLHIVKSDNGDYRYIISDLIVNHLKTNYNIRYNDLADFYCGEYVELLCENCNTCTAESHFKAWLSLLSHNHTHDEKPKAKRVV